MQGINNTIKRYEVPYFEGINSSVSPNLVRKGEIVHSENVRQEKIGLLTSRDGSTAVGNNISATEEYGLFSFSAKSGKGLYRIATVGATTSIYWKNSNTWSILSGEGTSLATGCFKSTVAEGNLYLVNYNDQNRMISGSDGTTVTDSTTVSGSLYNSPNASLITTYKGRLFLGDFLVGSTRNSTKVVRSSLPLGLVCLVSGDPVSPYTTITLTDTMYVYDVAGANTYDIYRAGTKIAVFTVSSLTEDTIVGTTVFEAGQTTIMSADELWISGTYTGEKIFRWPKNSSTTGTEEREYGTFSLQSSDGSPLTMLEVIGNKLIISNKTSMASWDDVSLDHFDMNIGCVSKNGYVKHFGGLYFLGYNGIYVTDGTTPKLISNKIERYLNGATKAGKEAAAMGKKGNSIFCYIGDVTLYRDDGSTEMTLSKVTLEFNTIFNLWFTHTGVSIKHFCTFVDTLDTDKLMIGNDESSALVLEYLSGTTDNGSAIPFRVDFLLPPLSGKFEKISHPVEIAVETLRGVGVKVFTSLDGGNWYSCNKEANKGVSIIKIHGKSTDFDTPPTCRRLGISFRKDSSQKTVLAGFSIYSTPTNHEVNDKESTE